MGVRVSEIGEAGQVQQKGRWSWSYPKVQKVPESSEGCRYWQAGHAFRCDTPTAHGLIRQSRQSEFNKNYAPADIRTAMNIYGDAATENMKQAHSKFVLMALPRA
jgi:hypothetical protein